jgi:ammonium transporter, Amt family
LTQKARTLHNLCLTFIMKSHKTPHPDGRQSQVRQPHFWQKRQAKVAFGGAALIAALLVAAPVYAQSPQPGDIGAVSKQLSLAINLLWMMIAAFMVFLMQVGFALVEAGFTRAKNVVHTMMMNLVVFCIAALGYWAVGFALQFGAINTEWPGVTTPGAVPGPWSHAPITLGDWSGILQTSLLKYGEQFSFAGGAGFGLSGMTLTAGVLVFFVFQMVFMDTAATIPTGAMAERLKFSGFCLMALFISMFLYPIVGSWVWGGGWLQNLGRVTGLGNGLVDFAGSGVVHMVGGSLALAGAIMLGPRRGRFNADGSVNPMPGHNIPLGVVGSIILVFGWFGFNAGSSYGVTGAFGQLAANAALNSLLAGAAGGVSGMVISWLASPGRKPDVAFTVNGMLGGLVSVTTACAFVESGAAVLIGIVAGVIVYASTNWLERVGIDDPVGAIPVHLFGGIWGLLAVGVFGAGLSITKGWNGMDRPVTGILFGNNGQLVMQLIGAASIFAAVFLAGILFFWVLRVSDLLRASEADETVGLDVAEMGTAGYNDEDATTANQPARNQDSQRAAWSFLTENSRAQLIPPALPMPRSADAASTRPSTSNGYVPTSMRARSTEDVPASGPAMRDVPVDGPGAPIGMSKPVINEQPTNGRADKNGNGRKSNNKDKKS